MVLEMARKRFKISCRVNTLRRVLGWLGFSYRKPRPIPDKSASETEQGEFKQETAGLLEEMNKQRHDPQLRIGPSMPIILQMCAPKHATFV